MIKLKSPKPKPNVEIISHKIPHISNIEMVKLKISKKKPNDVFQNSQ